MKQDIRDLYEKCFACNGEGCINVDVYCNNEYAGYTLPVTCIVCNGNGRIDWITNLKNRVKIKEIKKFKIHRTIKKV